MGRDAEPARRFGALDGDGAPRRTEPALAPAAEGIRAPDGSSADRLLRSVCLVVQDNSSSAER